MSARKATAKKASKKKAAKKKVMAKQGEAVTNKEAKAILERMDDIEHDGLISFEEFYQVRFNSILIRS